jgi:hypothetical protein
VRRIPDEIETWTGALALGGQKSGHSELAAALTATSVPVSIDFAHYANLFFPPGAQGQESGPKDLDDSEVALTLDLLAEAIDVQQQQERSASDRTGLSRAGTRVAPAGEAQGVGAVLRQAINAATTLLELPYLRKSGQWLSGRELVGQLGQVSRYLSRRSTVAGEPSLDHAVRARIHRLLEPGPTVVVAHSLGTVVAFESLHEAEHDVPLLVTLGSPLAMRTVIRPRLRPQPLSVPESVERWLNVWDRDDLVAARPLLEKDFAPNSLGVRPISERVDSDGVWVHPATKYLGQAAVAGPILEALSAAQHWN